MYRHEAADYVVWGGAGKHSSAPKGEIAIHKFMQNKLQTLHTQNRPSAMQQQLEAPPVAPGTSAATLTPGHKLGPPRAGSRPDQAHLGAQQHREAHFLAVCSPGDLAIHHRRFPRLCVCIARAHCVHLHICATSGQELLIYVGPLSPAGKMALSSLGLRDTVCTSTLCIPWSTRPLKACLMPVARPGTEQCVPTHLWPPRSGPTSTQPACALVDNARLRPGWHNVSHDIRAAHDQEV